MSYRFTIVGTTLADKVFGNLGNVSIANAFRNIGNHFQDVAIGAISESVTLNGGPTKGSGTISINSSNMSANDTVTINSVVLTAKTSPSGTAQFLVGSNSLDTAVSLAATINANPSLNTIVTAVASNGAASAGVVTVTAKANGTVGNYAWSKSSSNTTLSPASALSGGADGPVAATNVLTIASGNLSNGDTIVIGSQTFTAETSGATGPQFNIGASALVTAQNLAALINSFSTTANSFTAVATAGTSSSGVVTITFNYPGTVGNLVTVSKSATNGTWTHTSAFAGGTDANVQTFHKGI